MAAHATAAAGFPPGRRGTNAARCTGFIHSEADGTRDDRATWIPGVQGAVPVVSGWSSFPQQQLDEVALLDAVLGLQTTKLQPQLQLLD